MTLFPRITITAILIVSSILTNCGLNAQSVEVDPLKQQIDSLTNLVEKLKGYNENNKIFGHLLFKSDSLKILDAATITKIPDNYVIGVGDEITVSIFGESQLDGKFEVDQNGFINPVYGRDRMPKIFLQGLKWSQAKELITKRFSRYAIFNKNQIAITLTAPRTVTVNVFGNVIRPGTYSLPATNTAFNAIVAAGGPKADASVRNIKITDGSGQKTLDIYELMENPVKQFDYYLSDNAIIHLPLAKTIVHTVGAVLRPMDYELVEKDGLKELLDYSGGYRSKANKDLIQIKRYTNNALELLDINTKDINGRKIEMMNGDSIFISTISDEVVNAVSISGAVEMPGQFSLSSTKMISDLIAKAKLKKEAKTDIAYLYRNNDDNTSDIIEVDLAQVITNPKQLSDLNLQAKDRLVILSQSERATKSFVTVSGEVRRGTREPFDPDSTLTISKAVDIAGGLTDEAEDFGYLVRSKKDNPKEKSYIRINIKNAIDNISSSDNIKLYPNDEIIVLKKSDFSDQFYLYTKGAFRTQKKLFYDPKITINKLAELSNGLAPEASGKIDVYRLISDNSGASEVIVASIEIDSDLNVVNGDRDFKFQANDIIIARVKEDIDVQSIVHISGEVNYPGAYAMTSKEESLKDLIRKAGGITNQAFVNGIKLFRGKKNVKLDSIVYYPVVISNTNLNNNNLDILIKPNDRIIVPKKEDIVQIYLKNTNLNRIGLQSGTPNVIGVQYTKNKNVKWYIDNFAGGINSNAKWKDVLVEHPNGEVKKVTNKCIFFRKHPTVLKGSKIIVGTNQDDIKTENDTENMTNNLSKYAIPKSIKTLIINDNGTTIDDKKVEPVVNGDDEKKVDNK